MAFRTETGAILMPPEAQVLKVDRYRDPFARGGARCLSPAPRAMMGKPAKIKDIENQG